MINKMRMSKTNDRFWNFNLSGLCILNVIVMITLTSYIGTSLEATRAYNTELSKFLLTLKKETKENQELSNRNNEILRSSHLIIKELQNR